MFRRSFFLALVLLSVVPVLAQQPDLKQAQEAFSKGDYRSRSSFTRRSQKPILTTPTPGNASDSPIKQARSMIWLPALLKRP
ncbi:MAG: hypothetical protein ACRD33_02320, partial [Candidatus Acidiferrales bacterium]